MNQTTINELRLMNTELKAHNDRAEQTASELDWAKYTAEVEARENRANIEDVEVLISRTDKMIRTASLLRALRG